MGSREEGGQAQAQAKSVSGAMAVAPTAQELPSTPSAYPDWPSMAAYYGASAAAGAPPAFFSPASPSPYMWAGQHLMHPYGSPVPYHPAMYPPGMYPHPGMAPGPAPMAAAEMERRPEVKDHNSEKKTKSTSNASQTPGKPTNIIKEACTSANDENSHCDGSGTEGSSNAGDQLLDQQDSSATGKRGLGKMNAKGRIVMASPATNLNIGMDIWNGSHAGPVPMMERSGSVNMAPSVAPFIRQDGVVPGNQWDERELKRQKRKESNRESARRSRQRKQQECEELAKKVEELTSENNKFRKEIEQLKQQCKMLHSENMSMLEEFDPVGAPEFTSTVEGNNNHSSVNQIDSEGDHLDRRRTPGITRPN